MDFILLGGRTTRFEGEGDIDYQILVFSQNTKFIHKKYVIPNGEYVYRPYSDVDNSFNKDVHLFAYASLLGETDVRNMTPIFKLDIRDNAKIILRNRDGRSVTYKCVKGNYVARLRLIVKFKEWGKQFKLYGKQKLDEAWNKIDRLIIGSLAPQPLLMPVVSF